RSLHRCSARRSSGVSPLLRVSSLPPLLPPPPSPPFPYTTLFRSALLDHRRADHHRDELRQLPRSGHGVGQLRVERVDEVAGLRRDRKSTRLNSSHVSISYAVFCLKKKTRRTAQTDRATPKRARNS